MKRYQIYIFSLLLLSSCIIDSFIPVLIIKNNTGRQLKVYFSNTEIIDTGLLGEPSSIIGPHQVYVAAEGISIFNKKLYADTNTNLFLFIFDKEIFQRFRKEDTMDVIAKKSFLERRIIDMRSVTPADTIFYKDTEVTEK